MDDKEEKKDKIISFLIKYKGAMLGGIVALILVCTGLFKLLLGLIIITVRNYCWELYTKK